MPTAEHQLMLLGSHPSVPCTVNALGDDSAWIGVPVLCSQAPQAQGATIDGFSRATDASVPYARSLQAALDAAGA